MKSITIAGAGLAGLTLGNALQGAGVPTTIHEAGTLPRHRVCGEFICGRGADALSRLGLGDALEGALQHHDIHWYLRNKRILKSTLPTPAFGISRYKLDQRLACSFKKQGGQLLERSRVQESQTPEGTAFCSGRKASSSDWIGLKLHCKYLKTHANLELHLGENAYLGMSAIENGRVNVCALFKKRPHLKANREDCMHAYLDACGLTAVSHRIQSGGIDPKSHAGVAGILFSQAPKHEADKLRLGDAYSVIPPFTGNGMSIALESAEIAFPQIFAYAQDQQTWNTTVTNIQTACETRFCRRLKSAQQLHPWISQPRRQQTLAILSRLHLLPFRLLYAATH
jgi:flavin-dependent dehydrogenase